MPTMSNLKNAISRNLNRIIIKYQIVYNLIRSKLTSILLVQQEILKENSIKKLILKALFIWYLKMNSKSRLVLFLIFIDPKMNKPISQMQIEKMRNNWNCSITCRLSHNRHMLHKIVLIQHSIEITTTIWLILKSKSSLRP